MGRDFWGESDSTITLQGSGGIPTNQIASVTADSTVNYTYDAAGNVTNDGVHSYRYDSENRIVSVDGGSTASYAYDHQNRRYKKTVSSTVTQYVWQGSEVLAEHNGSTGVVLIDYVYSGSRMIAKVASGSTQYFLSDRLSERLALDTSGSVLGRMAHLPFGEDFAESGTQEKHHFTSYDRSAENGLDYAVNRWYSSSTGTFISADPHTPSGYMEDPRSWNRYSYTRNVLTNRMDPLGLEDKGASDTDPVFYHGPNRGDTLVYGVIEHGNTTPKPPESNPSGFGFGMIGLGGLFEGIGRAKGPPLIDGNGHGPAGAKKVKKHLTFRMPCQKDVVSAADELKARFTELADYTNVLLGWIKFEDLESDDDASTRKDERVLPSRS